MNKECGLPRGLMQKMKNSMGVKSTGNPGGGKLQKYGFPQNGGYNFSFLEKHISTFWCTIFYCIFNNFFVFSWRQSKTRRNWHALGESTWVFFFFYGCLPKRDSLFVSNELFSLRILPSMWNTSSERYGIRNDCELHHRMDKNSEPFDRKLNALTTPQKIHQVHSFIRLFA